MAQRKRNDNNSLYRRLPFLPTLAFLQVLLYHAVISITDFGCGIENIEQARQPFFTTDADGERSGMGFAVMEAFMDDVDVVSRRDIGTRITLKKFFSEPDYSAVCKDIADSKSDLHDEKSKNDSECISGRNTIEQTHGIIKAIRPSINVQNINARTSD